MFEAFMKVKAPFAGRPAASSAWPPAATPSPRGGRGSHCNRGTHKQPRERVHMQWVKQVSLWFLHNKENGFRGPAGNLWTFSFVRLAGHWHLELYRRHRPSWLKWNLNISKMVDKRTSSEYDPPPDTQSLIHSILAQFILLFSIVNSPFSGLKLLTCDPDVPQWTCVFQRGVEETIVSQTGCVCTHTSASTCTYLHQWVSEGDLFMGGGAFTLTLTDGLICYCV